MGQHFQHQPGTVSGCRDCAEVAYEPSWYASLLAFAETTRAVIALDPDVVVARA